MKSIRKSFKKFSSLCAIFFCFFWSGLVGAEIVEKTVAVVNNDVITLYDLDRAMAPVLAEGKRLGKPEGELKALRQKILEELIHQKLFEQEIKKSEIEVTSADLTRAIGGVLQKNQITIDMLKDELAGKGISFEAYKDQLQSQIRQYKFIQQNLSPKVQVTEQDIQNFRKKSQSGEEGDVSVKLAWVYLPVEPKASAKDRRKLVHKGTEMAELARKGEKPEGLLEEKVLKLKELPREVALVARKMEAGAISDPIETPTGVYVIQLLEKIPTATSVNGEGIGDEEIWQRLFNERLEREIQNYVRGLRRKAYVEVKEL